MRLLALRSIVITIVLAATTTLVMPAVAAPRPTPNEKACPICDEWEETREAVIAKTPLVTARIPAAATPPVAFDRPVVHGVLFWVEGCGHCEEVLTGVLPALQQQYGSQLDIQLLEVVTLEDTNRLYATAAALRVPKEQVGVPFLIVGDQVLIGSQKIPQKLPELVAQVLAAGGADPPDLAPLAGQLPDPALNEEACSPAEACDDRAEALTGQAAPSSATAASQVAPPLASLKQEFAQDLTGTAPIRPNGFGLAIAILAGMVAALIYSGATLVRMEAVGFAGRALARLEWLFLPLALAGLAVAGYLSYVETQMVEAVCGPVGDCNAVQGSAYAQLFGLIPIGVFGAAGYVAILAAWLVSRRSQGVLSTYAVIAVSGFGLFGMLFSLYLTYLEPFVIRAVCIWCLTSAVIITLLMLLSLGPLLRRMTEETGDV